MTDELENGPAQLPGAELRTQRERRGLTLPQAASELHVDVGVLRALEEDNYGALGAPIFVKGHLRNYARLLGLDPAGMIAQYEAAQQPADPELVAQRPGGPRMEHHQSSAWLGWLGWLFLLVVGVALAGWWYYQQEGGAGMMLGSTPDSDAGLREAEVPPSRQTTPTREANEPAAPVETFGEASGQTSGETSGETQTDPVPPVVEELEPAQETGTAVTESSPADTGTPARADESTRGVQAPPASQATRPATTAGRPLVFEFSQESWVEVYDAEGRPILYDLVGAGARREINATGELQVFLGNADGVEIFVRGQRFAHQRFRRADSTARFTLNVPE